MVNQPFDKQTLTNKNKNTMSDTKPQLKVNTGPFENVILLGHETVEDYDREAGKVGACLEDADFNVIYRDTLPTIHEKATKEIVTLSGLTPATNTKQTEKNQERENAAATKAGRTPKTVKPVDETFVTYIARVKATVDGTVWSAIDTKFREIALATPVDSSPSARVGAPSKANTEKAEQILTREDSAIEAVVATMSAKATSFDLAREADGKPNVTSLAKLVGTYMNIMEQEAKAAL